MRSKTSTWAYGHTKLLPSSDRTVPVSQRFLICSPASTCPPRASCGSKASTLQAKRRIVSSKTELHELFRRPVFSRTLRYWETFYRGGLSDRRQMHLMPSFVRRDIAAKIGSIMTER